jgi:anti-sigma factor RsiW
MTRMDCGEVRDLLHPYADDELPADERRAVAAHLEGCKACAAAYAGLEALRGRVKAAGSYTAPAGLEARVRAAIGMSVRAEALPMWRRIGWPALSHVAAALVGGLIAYGAVTSSDARELVVREAVTAHVRSLIGEQLTHVASSDTHTVKPWFAGKLPFAPDVRDLAAQSFPLAGGRVDYLLDRPAAVLVYGRRKHRINVFVLPAEQAPAATGLDAARHGYNVVGWRQGAFAYLAASDLNATELRELAAMLGAQRQ